MSEFTESLQITTSSDHGEGSLRWALEIAAQRESSVLEIDPSLFRIALEQPLPVIVSNLKLQGNGVTISGDHSCRILRIDAGNVELSDLVLVDGLARGEDGADGAGGDAGMGGALFIAAGEVSLHNIHFLGNSALGGAGRALPAGLSASSELNQASAFCSSQSSTPVRDDRGRRSSDSGLARRLRRLIRFGPRTASVNRGSASGIHGECGTGFGAIVFAGGGGFGGFANGGNGGNGGNGSPEGGHGGNGGHGGDGGVGTFCSEGPRSEPLELGSIAFSGGGGFGGFANGANGGNGGDGGFGGGGGAGGRGGLLGVAGLPGSGGFAGADGSECLGGSGAGLGGAIFLKSGRLRLNGCRFHLNRAIGGLGVLRGQGKGGAVFVLHRYSDGLGFSCCSEIEASDCSWVDNFASSAAGLRFDNHHCCVDESCADLS